MAKHVSEKIESYKERISKMKCVLICDIIRSMNIAEKSVAYMRHNGLFNVNIKTYECSGFSIRDEKLYVIVDQEHSSKKGLLLASEFNYEQLLEMVEFIGI